MPKLQDWLAKAQQQETVCFLASSGLDINDSALLIRSKRVYTVTITMPPKVLGNRHSRKAVLQLWSHWLSMQIDNKHRISPAGKLA